MHHHTQSDSPMATESFPTDPSGPPEAGPPQLLDLAYGDTLDLKVGPLAKRLGDTTVRMLAYNGSIPGPTLKVQQGSEMIVHVENHGPGHNRSLALGRSRWLSRWSPLDP